MYIQSWWANSKFEIAVEGVDILTTDMYIVNINLKHIAIKATKNSKS